MRYKGAVTEARLLRCLEMARVARNDIVLDAGCGRGEIALHVALRDGECVALDYSEDAILMTKDTLTNLPSREKVHVVLGDVDVLCFADRVFDKVFLIDIAEHLEEQEFKTALEEVSRVLRDSGYVVIHTSPSRWALDIGYKLARFAKRILRQDFLPPEPRTAYERSLHLGEQNPLRLKDLLKDMGFACKLWLEGFPQWIAGTPLERSPNFLKPFFYTEIFAIAWKQKQMPPEIIHDLDQTQYVSGFYLQENWPPLIRWTSKRAEIRLRCTKGRFVKIKIFSGPIQLNRKIEGSFALQGQRYCFTVEPGLWYDFLIPLCRHEKDAAPLVILVNQTFIPDQILGNGDQRKLGVAVGAVTLV